MVASKRFAGRVSITVFLISMPDVRKCRPGRRSASAVAAWVLSLALVTSATAYGQTAPHGQSEGKEPPDAGAGLVAAVAQMWLRTNDFVWEGPRLPIDVHAPHGERLLGVSTQTVVRAESGVTLEQDDVQRALSAVERARLYLRRAGWPSPWKEPFELTVGRNTDLSQTRAHVRELRLWKEPDRAWTYAAVDVGLLRFDPEACAVDAYARSMLLAMDPGESEAWRAASARVLTIEIVGRTCTDPFSKKTHAPLEDPATLQNVLTVATLRELWELGQQWTWEGMGVRASPSLWEVLAYISEGNAPQRRASDVWQQLSERLVLARGNGARADQHPPFQGKTRRVWGGLSGLSPYGVAKVRFNVKPGSPLKVWLRGEPGTRWLLFAEARDAQGRVLTSFVATSKNKLEATSEAVVYHPLELPTGTAEVVLGVGNLGVGARALSTPALHERGYHLVIDR